MSARFKLDIAAAEIVALKGVVTRLEKTWSSLRPRRSPLATKSRKASSRASYTGRYMDRRRWRRHDGFGVLRADTGDLHLWP